MNSFGHCFTFHTYIETENTKQKGLFMSRNTNNVHIKHGSLADIPAGGKFIDRNPAGGYDAWMKTADIINGGIICVNISTGDSYLFDSVKKIYSRCTDIKYDVTSESEEKNAGWLPEGTVFSFSGYSGEKFIRSFIVDTDNRKIYPRYYSLSTGKNTADTDLEKLPVTVYETEMIVTA